MTFEKTIKLVTLESGKTVWQATVTREDGRKFISNSCDPDVAMDEAYSSALCN